jgi:RimJ/RimL family protein N-acetyltransferase
VITTKRTVLKPLSSSDAAALFAYRSLPEVYRFQTWVPRSLDDARAFILRYSVHPPMEESDWRQLGIYCRTSKALIGDCGFRILEQREAEIGYTVAPSHQRQGLGTEVVRGLVNYLFQERQLERVIARTDVGNVGSITILEQTGFRRQAPHTMTLQTGGELEGDSVFSIQRGRWTAQAR